MLTLTSMVQAIEGKEDELEKHLVAFSKIVKTEKGTVVYALHRVKNAKGKFFFYEKFIDEKAFEFHNTTPHMQELAKKIGSLLASEPQLTYLDEIS